MWNVRSAIAAWCLTELIVQFDACVRKWCATTNGAPVSQEGRPQTQARELEQSLEPCPLMCREDMECRSAVERSALACSRIGGGGVSSAHARRAVDFGVVHAEPRKAPPLPSPRTWLRSHCQVVFLVACLASSLPTPSASAQTSSHVGADHSPRFCQSWSVCQLCVSACCRCFRAY
jgi:hypothetical protein